MGVAAVLQLHPRFMFIQRADAPKFGLAAARPVGPAPMALLVGEVV